MDGHVSVGRYHSLHGFEESFSWYDANVCKTSKDPIKSIPMRKMLAQ